jgi:hypothetical protein
LVAGVGKIEARGDDRAVFEGDPFLDDRVRQEAAKEWSGFSLRRLEKDQQGVLRCTQDVKLRR